MDPEDAMMLNRALRSLELEDEVAETEVVADFCAVVTTAAFFVTGETSSGGASPRPVLRFRRLLSSTKEGQ